MSQSGPVLNPGDFSNFGGSMAEAIDQALDALMTADKKPALAQPPAPDARDRQRFFIAIAQGILTYLQTNEDAITVTIPAGGTGGTVNVNIAVQPPQ